MISIVIPTYNRAKLLSKILDNVYAQSSREWECIVVDDHSLDNTREVVQKYVQEDKRFRYIVNNRAKGAQGARNTGILASKYEWICLFDSDDCMYPDYLERMAAVIDENTDVVVCKALIRNTLTGQANEILDTIFSDNYHRDLLRLKCYVAYDVTIIRKEKLLAIGLLDENCPSTQEWDTHIRLSRIARYKAIDETLCEWYTGGKDAISTDRRRQVNGHLYVFNKHKSEWRKDKVADRMMVKQIYKLLQETKDMSFRLVSFLKLAIISPYAIRYALGCKYKQIQRNLKKLYIA